MDGFRSWGARLSNWGRWGPDDQLGTLNLLTPERVAAAARLVEAGEVVPLGLPLDADGPQVPGGGRFNPVHVMTRTAAATPSPSGFHYMDDLLVLYPQSATQVDALAHVAYDGRLYNDTPVELVGNAGAARLGVETMRRGIVGRGILVDLPRQLGVGRLDPRTTIGPAELDACLAAQGVVPEPGDILLLRTGWLQVFREEGAAAYLAAAPGLGLEAAGWLREHDIAFTAADTWSVERVPAVDPREEMPVHCVLVRDLGMPLGEMLDLELLAQRCEDRGRWAFWFSAEPLAITGGVGSPIEPKAIL